jgi:alcohol dehydrogenase (cytochrome c)
MSAASRVMPFRLTATFSYRTGGAVVAVDAKTGNRRWHFETGQVWQSSPMTYAVDGKQFIGVVAGSAVRVFGLPD